MAVGNGVAVQFEFDQNMLAAIERKLGDMRSQAPRVFKLALNDTARQAKSDLAKKAQETYAVKVGGFSKNVRLEAATTSTLEAWLKAKGSRLPITRKNFSVQGGKGPKGPYMKTLIKKSEGQHTWGSRAFHNVLGKSGHQGAAEYVGGGQPGRLHIKTLYTVSVPQMLGNEREVYGIVEPHIMENLQNNVNRHVARILNGG